MNLNGVNDSHELEVVLKISAGVQFFAKKNEFCFREEEDLC